MLRDLKVQHILYPCDCCGGEINLQTGKCFSCGHLNSELPGDGGKNPPDNGWPSQFQPSDEIFYIAFKYVGIEVALGCPDHPGSKFVPLMAAGDISVCAACAAEGLGLVHAQREDGGGK